MGFIKAFTGAISTTFADQWKEFYMPREDVPATAALFQAVQQRQNAGVGENTKGNDNVISNGSKIIVPEGMALITIQDGAITGFISEPGGFIYESNDPNSQSIFAGDGIVGPLVKTTWEKVKFGGQPGSQQLAFYVNLKEISGNKFGTPEIIYWYDSYLELQAGGMAKGTYSLKIVDPLLFVKNFVPLKYIQPNAPVFDFADMDNEAGTQLFDEFITCLTSGVSKLSQTAKSENIDTMAYLQANQAKFATTMDEEVESTYNWSTLRGIKVESVSATISYDEKTLEALEEIRDQDAELRKARRMGSLYSQNMAGMMAADSGQAMKTAAGNEAGAMIGFMGMNMAQQNGANMLGAVSNMQQQQPVQPIPSQPVQPEQAQPTQPIPPQPVQQPVSEPTQKDPYEELKKLKSLLDAGVITQEDFDTAKAKFLGNL